MRTTYKELGLSQLRSFCAVCQLGSYAAVARRLHLTTSTVWEQMRGLERQFEARLLENHGGEVRPTREGEQLRELVAPLLEGLESTKEVFQQQRGRPPAAITLASGIRMLLDEVGPVLPHFQKRYPGVRLRLLFEPDRQIESLVEQGEADLGLILEPDPARPTHPALAYEPAYEWDYLLVTPPGHALLAKRGLRLEDIVRHPLVVTVPGTASRRRIEEVLHQHQLFAKMQVSVETSSIVMTYAYVRSGAGIGIAVGNPSGFLCQGLGLRSLRQWFGAARYVFVWRRGAYVPPAQRALADLIRSSPEGQPVEGEPSPGMRAKDRLAGKSRKRTP